MVCLKQTPTFAKAAFQNFYLVHSWTLCPICGMLLKKVLFYCYLDEVCHWVSMLLLKEAWHSERGYLLSLEKFLFSFKDLNNHEHKIQTFELHTNHELYFMHPGQDNVCDRTGFALIFYIDGIQQLYYYDFKRKFTTYINIPFRLNKCYSVKLYRRTLWILNRKISQYIISHKINPWYQKWFGIFPGSYH